MTEQKTIQQIALDFVDSRSEKSFNILYDRLKPGLRKFIYKFHQDFEVVDEILAITLSKAFVYVERYDNQWNFSTWIYKICQNECLMELRRQNSLLSLNSMMENKAGINAVNDGDWKEEVEYEFFDNSELVEQDSLYSEVLAEIENLPQHYKEIISDRVILKMKYKDISEKRGLKINTVRSRIHSAKKVIKNLWVDKKAQTASNDKLNLEGIGFLKLSEAEKMEESFHLISALYGTELVSMNVMDQVHELLNTNGSLKVSNKINGDPSYGSKKFLTVKYSLNGKVRSETIQEGKIFKIN